MVSHEQSEPATSSQPSSQSRPAADRVAGAADRAEAHAGNDESPELLRWRAELLLDEMMLGGVDHAGYPARDAEQGAERSPENGSANGRDDRADSRNAADAYQAGGTGSSPAAWTQEPGSAFGPRLPDLTSDTIEEPADPAPGRRPGYSADAPDSAVRDNAVRDNAVRDDVWGPDWGTLQTEGSGPAADVYADPAYAPFARGSSATERAPAMEESVLRPPAGAADSVDRTDIDAQHSGRARWGERPHSPYVNRQSDLLPRMSQKDARELRQELTTLQDEVEQNLPVDHDWRMRSDHLLEKADRLLRTDPGRTAEVEYYLQQVHAILERARQTGQSSSVYMRRLAVYHAAWLLLGLVLLAGCLLFARPLSDWLAIWWGIDPGTAAASLLVPGVATLASAVVGTALGALRNMQRHHRRDRGFFDRNYSLRGLLLPVFALLVAVLIYAGFGLVYRLADLNLFTIPLAALVPAVFAFLFGFLQESVYGTAP